VAITAAVAVASEADRISAVPFAQAVVVFRHGPHQSDVLGLQKPPVHPVYDGTDPLCVDEQKPHVCGLLLSEGGDGVTVASLEFPRSPRIVAVPHDEVASTFVVPAETDIGADQATYRRSPLYCRLPLLKELTRRRCGRAVRPIGLPTIAGIPTKGQTLTESHGSWSNSPTRFSYQWQDCDRYGTDCSTIAHATRQTYVLAAGDVSSTLRVQETASNAGGSSSPSRSRPSALVRSLPRPPHRRRT
jgi:hypothetical protein